MLIMIYEQLVSHKDYTVFFTCFYLQCQPAVIISI